MNLCKQYSIFWNFSPASARRFVLEKHRIFDDMKDVLIDEEGKGCFNMVCRKTNIIDKADVCYYQYLKNN
jgi:hypothetical protein